MNSQELGQGWWLNADSYSQIVALPVMKSVHIITSNIIREKLKDGPIKVLSLGVGSGVLYKNFFKQEVAENKLQLYGIDFLQDMLLQCQKEFPNAILKHDNLISFDQFFSEKFDVIEAVFVLHHILRFEELKQLVRKVYDSLKSDGLFIIGDIDLSCAEHIEEKLIKLEKEHGALSVDLNTGEFFNDKIRVPILSLDNFDDQKALRRLKLLTCMPLMKELGNLVPEQQEKLRHLVVKDIDSANMGLEWLRGVNTPLGWKALIKESFTPSSDLDILLPDAIKAGFPEVLDSPFVLVARK